MGAKTTLNESERVYMFKTQYVEFWDPDAQDLHYVGAFPRMGDKRLCIICSNSLILEP